MKALLAPGEEETVKGLKDILARREHMTQNGLVSVMSFHLRACIEAGLIADEADILARCMTAALDAFENEEGKHGD